MSDIPEDGPSRPKRSKIVIRNPNKLTNEELEAFVDEPFTSDEDEEYLPSSDDNMDENSSVSEAEVLDIEPDNPRPISPAPAPIDNVRPPNPIWNDTCVGMKNIMFSKTNHLLVPTPPNKPIGYFRMLVDDQFLNSIVEETNLYAEQVFQSQGITENSRITKWKPITTQELLKFLALVLHTGTIKLNRIQDYWKSHSLFNLTCFSTHMSRDRFLVILRCLHFARNPAEGEATPNDRLYKIRPVLDFFNEKMSNVYYPNKQLSLDESMVLWRGRLIFRQYIKNKRHKYGKKLYMLTEPNGLILKTTVYTGTLDDLGGKGHASKVVFNLMEGKLNFGHSIYMDNFYNSYQLAEDLLKNGTYCTGTLRKDRKGNPKDVISAKLGKGETCARYCNDIMVGKWKDKRDVIYISTEWKNDLIEYTDKRNRPKQKPLPIVEYNKYMSGVDMQDQMNSYYPCERKTLRWYTKLGIHIIQLMLLNSYFLYQKYSGNKMTFYDFRLAVLQELLDVKGNKETRASSSKVREHYPTKIAEVNKKGETQRKRCRECHKQKIRKNSIYHCEMCPERPGLCPGSCFTAFHKE